MSTVVTTTITTITTTTTSAVMGMSVFIGILAVFTLMAFLATKELASASNGPRLRFLSSALNVGTVPLFLAFVFTVVLQSAAILS